MIQEVVRISPHKSLNKYEYYFFPSNRWNQDPIRDAIDGLCPTKAPPGLMELEWLPVPVPDVPEAVVAPGISINLDLYRWCVVPDPVVDTEELLSLIFRGRLPTIKWFHK